MTIVCAPAALVAAGSVLFGHLDAHGVRVLVRSARGNPWLHGDVTTVFTYLADDVQASFGHIAHFPTEYLVGSMFVATVLGVLQASTGRAGSRRSASWPP